MRIVGKVRTVQAKATIAAFDPAAGQAFAGVFLILGLLLLLISP